jgi:hypothetical protein
MVLLVAAESAAISFAVPLSVYSSRSVTTELPEETWASTMTPPLDTLSDSFKYTLFAVTLVLFATLTIAARTLILNVRSKLGLRTKSLYSSPSTINENVTPGAGVGPIVGLGVQTSTDG